MNIFIGIIIALLGIVVAYVLWAIFTVEKHHIPPPEAPNDVRRILEEEA